MAEEETTQAEAVVEQTDEDFDWGQFFANDEAPAPVDETPPGVAAVYVDESEDDLRAQLKVAQETSARALEMATQAQTQGQMQNAIAAWKAQASPAELQHLDIMMDSASPEELQKNAKIVKKAASKFDVALDERVKVAEAQMQRKFGLPVPPTFQPMPEKEKVATMLKEGQLEDAAATMMKGF